jgi:hypothetical protein
MQFEVSLTVPMLFDQIYAFRMSNFRVRVAHPDLLSCERDWRQRACIVAAITTHRPLNYVTAPSPTPRVEPRSHNNHFDIPPAAMIRRPGTIAAAINGVKQGHIPVAL